MTLGRVVGCVWCTVKHPGMQGLRLLVVQPLTPELQDTGKRIICTDSTGAGAGETVYWVRGKEASFPFLPAEPPTDTTIVGIVDSVHVKRMAGLAAGRTPPPTAANTRPGNTQSRKGKAKSC